MRSLLLISLLVFPFLMKGQVVSDSIFYGKVGGKNSFYTIGKNLSVKDASTRMDVISEARSRMLTAKYQATIGYSLLALGGATVLYSASNSIIKKENIDVRGIALGLSLAMISSYFQYLKKKNYGKAVDAFNGSLSEHSDRRLRLNFGFTNSGMGVSLHF